MDFEEIGDEGRIFETVVKVCLDARCRQQHHVLVLVAEHRTEDRPLLRNENPRLMTGNRLTDWTSRVRYGYAGLNDSSDYIYFCQIETA